MTRALTIAILSTLLGAACCATTGPAPADDASAIAPVPFPAALIRAHTSDGRTYLFRIEEAGKPAMLERMRFTDVDDDGATLSEIAWPADGPAPEAAGEAAHVTWDALEHHGHYPRAATTIVMSSTDVPAGHFDCRLYTVAGDGSVTRAWFADALPGAPVRLEVSGGGAVVMSMVLVEHTPGR